MLEIENPPGLCGILLKTSKNKGWMRGFEPPTPRSTILYYRVKKQ